MNYLSQKKNYADYESYLRGLKTHNGDGVTHLLIRPYLLINAYKDIFPDYDRSAMQNFIEFLNRQKFLFQSGDTRLYELTIQQAG